MEKDMEMVNTTQAMKRLWRKESGKMINKKVMVFINGLMAYSGKDNGLIMKVSVKEYIQIEINLHLVDAQEENL